MDTQALIARLRERAATHDAAGGWSLDRAVADELERLSKIDTAARAIISEDRETGALDQKTWNLLVAAIGFPL